MEPLQLTLEIQAASIMSNIQRSCEKIDRAAAMPLRIGSILFVVMLSGVIACSEYQPYEAPPGATPLLSIGEWFSFSGHELTFYVGGMVVYRKGGPKDKISHLTGRELLELETFLESEDLEMALAILRQRGYVPGCCDGHEVSFSLRDESFGYPVCDDHTIDESVARLVDLINELGGRHFRHFEKNSLPKTTCSEPASTQ